MKATLTDKRYTRKLCRDNPRTLYVFGDNVNQTGRGGQACIRDEPNAIGIPTKKLPSRGDDAYFTDREFDANAHVIDVAILRVSQRADGYDRVVFPQDGLGTGLAKLPEKAPMTYGYLVGRIYMAFGVVWNDPCEV